MGKLRLASTLLFGIMIWNAFAFAGSAEVLVPFDQDLLQNSPAISSATVLPSQMKSKAREKTLTFGLSTWMPSQLNLPGQIGSEIAFNRTLPEAYINFRTQLFAESHELIVMIGGNWLALQRTAVLDVGGSSINQTQQMQLLSARAGVEYVPSRFQSPLLKPYVGLSLLPTVALTGESAFEKGSTYFGVAGEFALGLRMPLAKLGLQWQGAEFDLGWTGALGRMENSSLNGMGINAGVKVSL